MTDKIPPMSKALQRYTRDIRVFCLEYAKNETLISAEELYTEICKRTLNHGSLHPEQHGELDAEYNIFRTDLDEDLQNLHIELSRGITVGWRMYSKIAFSLSDANHNSTIRIMELGTTDMNPEQELDARLTYLDSECTSFRIEYIDNTNIIYSIEFGMIERLKRSELYPYRTKLIRTNGVLEHRPLLDEYYFKFKDPFDTDEDTTVTKMIYRSLSKEMKEFEYTMRTGDTDTLREDMTTWNINRTRRAEQAKRNETNEL